jgi:hypothetical protein
MKYHLFHVNYLKIYENNTLIRPINTDTANPNTRVGPATLNILAPTPKIYPSLLNSMAEATMALANPVIGTIVPAPVF